jgi:lipoprotein-anchoring transpeptidase ErfK/SrfK
VLASTAHATPKELTIADLEWPASSKSAQALVAADVANDAGKRAVIGKLAKGTRVGWKRIVAASDRCRAYVEIEPRGWICAKDLAPSDQPPAAAPTADPAKILDHVLDELHFGVVPDGGKAYDSQGAITRNAGKKLVGWTFLHGPVGAFAVVGGTMFLKTLQGYIAASDLMLRPASEFEGIAIASTTTWPFGWIMPGERDEPVAVRATPSPTGARVRDAAYRSIVPVLDVRAKEGFARIADNEWVPLAALHVARITKRPKGVRADERWIDVDTDEKVMVTYQGDTPVYATLVSTGFGGATPISLHRIVQKRATMTLTSPAIATGTWSIPDVPFTMIFRKYYAVHAAYWHDSFGKQRGHGCVNLSPRDARHLYDWTLPEVPAGWLERDAVGSEGTPIRIRNRANPDPPWTDYDSEPPVPTKTNP